MKVLRLSEICVGHLTKTQSLEDWCKTCKRDEFNKQCPYYYPIRLYDFKVEETNEGYKNE